MTPSENVLQYFSHSHLPEPLQAIVRPIASLALEMEALLPDGPEKTMGLRKLLEAKDCLVRANLVGPETPWWQTTDLMEMFSNSGVIRPNSNSNPAVANINTSPKKPTYEQRHAYTKGGQCFGPTAIKDTDTTSQGYCFLELCTWTSKTRPVGAWSMDELKREHHTAEAPLTKEP